MLILAHALSMNLDCGIHKEVCLVTCFLAFLFIYLFIYLFISPMGSLQSHGVLSLHLI